MEKFAARSTALEFTEDGKLFMAGCVACTVLNLGAATVTLKINGGNPIRMNFNQALNQFPQPYIFPAVEGLVYIDDLEFTFGNGENLLHINRIFKVPLLAEVEKTLYNAPK